MKVQVGAGRRRAALVLVAGAVDRRAVRVLGRGLVLNRQSWPIFMPGQSLIGSVATLDSSSVTCPVNPGSIQPAVECVSRPSRPSELLPSSRPAMSSGSETTS